jgi:hypothetical protein
MPFAYDVGLIYTEITADGCQEFHDFVNTLPFSYCPDSGIGFGVYNMQFASKEDVEPLLREQAEHLGLTFEYLSKGSIVDIFGVADAAYNGEIEEQILDKINSPSTTNNDLLTDVMRHIARSTGL